MVIYNILKVPKDLPIPDLIDQVDFRVTFTINGVPYTPTKIEPDVEKVKLPDLPHIPLPKFQNVSDPRNNSQKPAGDPRDPRRRLSQTSLVSFVLKGSQSLLFLS